MKAVNAIQMQQIDRRTIEEIGIPGVVLMENAGRQTAEAIVQRYRERLPHGVLVLAGKGNNGGDGFVIARHLLAAGWPVLTLLLADQLSAVRGDAAINLHALKRCGGDVRTVDNLPDLTALLSEQQTWGVLVDALFGTGLSKPVGGLYAEAIAWLNRRDEPVVAVDIPSGVDAGSGRILGCAVQATLTVTFAQPKTGQLSWPGAGQTGELRVVDIGIPKSVVESVAADAVLVDAADAAALLPDRPVAGHKGTFGHLLVVAGSLGKSGAATLAARAALRGGAGLVTLACPETIQPVVAGQLAEAMTVPLPAVAGELSATAIDPLLALLADKQALAFGPGIGVGKGSRDLTARLLAAAELPLVIDADGLNALAGQLPLLERRRHLPTVLTPHPGEMARLTGLSVAAIQADRVAIAREFAGRHQLTLVLKGARTVTATADGRIFINGSGHAGLATAGMGDVLTGLIGSLLAQGLPAEQAAPLAVYLHGTAADRLLYRYGDAGLLAGDLIEELPGARRELKERRSC
ncbi:MAG: NAD(P)H-hydrate dehydratase [Desulfuromonadales bacterium]|nr:NAD(P)H-hydrate dehydratase [Desulfuromonadales bacterium]